MKMEMRKSDNYVTGSDDHVSLPHPGESSF